MKLTDLELAPTKALSTSLQEHFGVKLDLEKLNYSKTKQMLDKVRWLVTETKKAPAFYQSQNDPKYMQLLFMEQALSKHFSELSKRTPRIVVENEEVEKSQVVLAAQDMVDSVQKMVEETSDMLVKELPALVDSIQSEIGVNESQDFNQQATEALSSLQAALTQSKATLQNALSVVTGGGGMMDMSQPAPVGGEEMSMDSETEIVEPETPEPTDLEEPEIPPVAGAGRAKR